MKVVLLAGGKGTRISEESYLRPKPMINIGGMPILWHIMKTYSHYGYDEFIVCCGYMGYAIKEYFADYYLHNSDITFDFSDNNKMIIHNNFAEPWKVTLVDTGLETMTGGRIKRIQKYVDNQAFLLTYGDGVCDVPIDKLVAYHKSHGKIGTMTTIRQEGRFGVLDFEDNRVASFREKSKSDTGWINGGFMVMQPEIFNYIDNDETIFELKPLENLANDGELIAYKHNGFWQCMDTLRDKEKLEEIWSKANAPWKVWQN